MCRRTPTSATVAEVGVDVSRTTARRSTPRSSSSSTTKSPKRSAPTLPATAARSPSRASALAVFSAQPPPWSSISPARPSVPRAGSSSTGRQMTSATRIPRQTTSTPRSSHSPRNVVRFRPRIPTGGHMTLEGKVALVTGASRGIGAAVARMLDERGVKLGLASRSGDDLGLDAVAQPCDVRELDQLESIVAATVERFGRLDILVVERRRRRVRAIPRPLARAPRRDDRRQPEGDALRGARGAAAPRRVRPGATSSRSHPRPGAAACRTRRRTAPRSSARSASHAHSTTNCASTAFAARTSARAASRPTSLSTRAAAARRRRCRG